MGPPNDTAGQRAVLEHEGPTSAVPVTAIPSATGSKTTEESTPALAHTSRIVGPGIGADGDSALGSEIPGLSGVASATPDEGLDVDVRMVSPTCSIYTNICQSQPSDADSAFGDDARSMLFAKPQLLRTVH